MARTRMTMYSLKELAAILVKSSGFHEGHFELTMEFEVGVGVVGTSENEVTPGAMIGAKKVGLLKVDEPNPLSVDASVVNPASAMVATRKTPVRKKTVAG